MSVSRLIAKHLRRFPESFATLSSVYNGLCALWRDTVTPVQCVTFGFFLQLMLPFCLFPLQAKLSALRGPKALKALRYFGVSLSPLQCHCCACNCHAHFNHRVCGWKDKGINKDAELTGYRTTFNGNTLQKLSSLQTSFSASDCEVVKVVL